MVGEKSIYNTAHENCRSALCKGWVKCKKWWTGYLPYNYIMCFEIHPSLWTSRYLRYRKQITMYNGVDSITDRIKNPMINVILLLYHILQQSFHFHNSLHMVYLWDTRMISYKKIFLVFLVDVITNLITCGWNNLEFSEWNWLFMHALTTMTFWLMHHLS